MRQCRGRVSWREQWLEKKNAIGIGKCGRSKPPSPSLFPLILLVGGREGGANPHCGSHIFAPFLTTCLWLASYLEVHTLAFVWDYEERICGTLGSASRVPKEEDIPHSEGGVTGTLQCSSIKAAHEKNFQCRFLLKFGRLCLDNSNFSRCASDCVLSKL